MLQFRKSIYSSWNVFEQHRTRFRVEFAPCSKGWPTSLDDRVTFIRITSVYIRIAWAFSRYLNHSRAPAFKSSIFYSSHASFIFDRLSVFVIAIERRSRENSSCSVSRSGNEWFLIRLDSDVFGNSLKPTNNVTEISF